MTEDSLEVLFCFREIIRDRRLSEFGVVIGTEEEILDALRAALDKVEINTGERLTRGLGELMWYGTE